MEIVKTNKAMAVKVGKMGPNLDRYYFLLQLHLIYDHYYLCQNNAEREKTITDFVEKYKEGGGQFVSWNGDSWQEANEEEIKAHVQHTIHSEKFKMMQECKTKKMTTKTKGKEMKVFVTVCDKKDYVNNTSFINQIAAQPQQPRKTNLQQ